MTKRTEQVESVLQRAISQVINHGLSDPRIRGMISVTRLDISPDMRHCAVFISVLPAEYEKRSLAGLKAATGHIYTKVCGSVALSIVPRLDFRLDKTLKKTAEVLDAIRKAADREAQFSEAADDVDREPES